MNFGGTSAIIEVINFPDEVFDCLVEQYGTPDSASEDSNRASMCSGLMTYLLIS